MSDPALAGLHRLAVARLSSRPERELRGVLAAVGDADAIVVRDALMETVPVLAETYGDAAGALAVDYYDEARETAAAAGRYRAEPAPLPGTARYEALVRWGVDPLFEPGSDRLRVLSRVVGGLQRIIADVDRETIATNAVNDPQAAGWRRVTRSDSCKFCSMLAARGAVYSESSVRFASHDNCNCAAAPTWDPGNELDAVQYVASKRNVTDADRARVRAYLRNNDF